VILRLLLATTTAGCLLAAGCGGSGDPGNDLLFVSTRDGDYAIFGMDADGGSQGRLTDERGDTSTNAGIEFQIEPAWSPDGRRIAFASAREGSFDIYVMAADGTDSTRLTTSRVNDRRPSWSPDGTRIVFARSVDESQLFVMNADGTGARRVTDDAGAESEPAWSPDGEWIAYVRRQPGTELREIWLVRPDGSDRRRLTRLNGLAYAPAWSPDGERIAFSADRGDKRYAIWTIGVDGTGLRRVTPAGIDAFEPAWSPDGRLLAFSRDGAIVTVDEEGNEVQVTDPQNNDSSPAWNPRSDVEKEES
jgi:Tol biopolymer transport system component